MSLYLSSAKGTNTQQKVNSLRTELEKTRNKMSNMEADSKKKNVIMHSFDSSRRIKAFQV